MIKIINGALALLEANGVHEVDLAAELLGGVGDILLDRAGEHVAADELLLEQAVLRIELVELAHDDLLADLLGLAGHLGVVGHLSHHDLLLLVENVLRDLALIPEAGIERRDLHGNVLGDLGGVDAAVDLEVDEHADLAAGMDIRGGGVGREAGKAADLNVLADDEDHLLTLLLNGTAIAVGSRHQSLEILGVFLGDDSGNALDEVLELLVLADEVGLGVDLDHDAHAVDDGSVSHTLGSDAAGLLRGSGETLFAQVLDRLVDVAVALGQSLLAVHHAHAGHFAQVLNISSGKSHNLFPPII